MEKTQEQKAILRAWLYRLLADIEECEMVDASREVINGNRVILEMNFEWEAQDDKA